MLKKYPNPILRFRNAVKFYPDNTHSNAKRLRRDNNYQAINGLKLLAYCQIKIWQ